MYNVVLTLSHNDESSVSKKNKRNKGKSLIKFPEDYVSFDLETTGLSPLYDEIIEIGAVKVHKGEIVDKYQTLVKPKEPINDFITELTGITNEMVANAPKINDVIPTFRNFIGGNIIVGHNVNFDINFIYDFSVACDNTPFVNDYIDTMRIARKLYPEMPHHRLKDIVNKLNVKATEFHRALADAIMTSECIEIMHKEVISKYSNEDEFYKLFKKVKKTSKNKLNAKDLSATVTEFDETHDLYGKSCVFTGTLEKMTRREAMQIVLNYGGSCENNVTKKTNFLILGNYDYCSSIKEGKSSKYKKAEKNKLEGQDIEIISETVFYDMIE